METSADTSKKAFITQFTFNLIAAQSYSQMNAFGSALQLIIYDGVLLDVEFDEDADKSVQAFLGIVQLDYIPEAYLEWYY